MAIDNDTRGWILAGLSGLACIFGALFICIDVVVRCIPGKRNWKMQDSNGFLSCSLSLSAGVMVSRIVDSADPITDSQKLFSSLYKLLPESKSTLMKGGFSSKNAAWILIACFLAGVWGIQIISRVMHFVMPSHIVDCDHTHDRDPEDQKADFSSQASKRASPNGNDTLETAPLLVMPEPPDSPSTRRDTTQEMVGRTDSSAVLNTMGRPSLQKRLTRKMSQFVSGEKSSCNVDGPCKGYTSPCGQECFRNINARGGIRAPTFPPRLSARPTMRRAASTSLKSATVSDSAVIMDARQDRGRGDPARPGSASESSGVSGPSAPAAHASDASHHQHDHDSAPLLPQASEMHATDDGPHHHHVPENAFLALSFQTSIGLVLHKLPEGFITFASNHANPTLGFNIFMALAIHNITEGFALALPIYLATNSRWRALLYSSLLGGLSQPLGAAIAALWLGLAEMGRGDYTPSQKVYGGLFALTAGILATVALNLLSQSFELSHNRGLCMFFVFVGMAILGVSSALIA